MKQQTKDNWKKFFHGVGVFFQCLGAICKLLLQIIVIILIPIILLFWMCCDLAKPESQRTMGKINWFDIWFFAWLFGQDNKK